MDPVLDVALRGSLALLFLVAAGHKLRDPGAFRATLADYRLLPARTTTLAATLVPGAELVAAGALLFPVGRSVGPLLTTALLVVYTGAIAINLARGRRDIDCGCAGPAARQPLGGGLVARNAVLVAGALGCLVPLRPRPLVWIDAVTATGAIAVLAGLYAALERMMATAPALARLRERA
jgi:hypothetical protein